MQILKLDFLVPLVLAKATVFLKLVIAYAK